MEFRNDRTWLSIRECEVAAGRTVRFVPPTPALAVCRNPRSPTLCSTFILLTSVGTSISAAGRIDHWHVHRPRGKLPRLVVKPILCEAAPAALSKRRMRIAVAHHGYAMCIARFPAKMPVMLKNHTIAVFTFAPSRVVRIGTYQHV